jgi:energy-converting hydrogenase A subunit M
MLHPSESLTGWVDSDWAQEPGRKSVYGYCFQANGYTFLWKSKRLSIVVHSSMEAEFMAAREVVREAMHLLWLNYFMQGTMVVVNIKADNASALSQTRNLVLEDIRKHIDKVYNHIRERQDAGYVDFCWVRSVDNVADIFTKALTRPACYKLRDTLHLSASNS